MSADHKLPEWIELLPDEEVKFYEEMGYGKVLKINGKIVGLNQFMFTCGIVVGMNETGYEHRYCYHNATEAFGAMCRWIIEGGEEPLDYIKRKG